MCIRDSYKVIGSKTAEAVDILIVYYVDAVFYKMISCIGHLKFHFAVQDVDYLYILIDVYKRKAQAMWPVGYQQLQDPDSGIFELLAKIQMVPHMDIMFLVVDNIGSVACALSGQAAVIRIMYNMGRDNILPKKIFGQMSSKGVPFYNLIIVGFVGLVALFFTDNILGGVELVSFGAITGFIPVSYTHLDTDRSPRDKLRFQIVFCLFFHGPSSDVYI